MIEKIKKLIPVIKIKNFPSKEGLIKDFKSYLFKNKSKVNYKISYYNNSNNKMYLHLSNSSTAYDFTEDYNKKILSNPHYSKTKCSLFFIKPDSKRESSLNLLKKNHFNKVSNLFKYVNSRKVQYGRNSNILNKSCPSISTYERKHWADVREKAGIIDNDSPYIDLLDKEYNEKILGMKKWIINKDFNVHIGKASSIINSRKNEIKNYVMRTPSLPPVLHQFRDINKTKWVGKSDFQVY